VVGLGATGTLAYWTDDATINAGEFTSGTLDLTAGPTTGSENLTGTGPNTWSYGTFTLTGMIPGDSVSKTIVLRNSGDAPLRVNGTVTSTTNDLTTTAPANLGIQIVIVDQAAATAATTDATTGVRTGGCSPASTPVYSQFVSTTSTGTNIFATAPSLLSTQTRSLCVRAVLSPSAPNGLQTRSTTIKIDLTATQVGAP
jgi:predicted ribosomally synthesized peptide with SipW-like signal peptide